MDCRPDGTTKRGANFRGPVYRMRNPRTGTGYTREAIGLTTQQLADDWSANRTLGPTTNCQTHSVIRKKKGRHALVPPLISCLRQFRTSGDR